MNEQNMLEELDALRRFILQHRLQGFVKLADQLARVTNAFDCYDTNVVTAVNTAAEMIYATLVRTPENAALHWRLNQAHVAMCAYRRSAEFAQLKTRA